jgi:CheY-like chemotaxis protein
MNGLTLLLVEDNVLNQKLIFLNLVKYGFKIDVANNGLEALEKFKERKYKLILMDLMMPVMDGLEATRQIRFLEAEKGSHTPIVGLTANTYDADREKCLSHGMDEFMTKPFDIEVFHVIVKRLGIEINN